LERFPAVLAVPGVEHITGSKPPTQLVIEPQLREIANATVEHRDLPGHLKKYTPIVNQEGQDWVDVWLEGPIDRTAVRALGGRIGTFAGGVSTAHIPISALNNLLNIAGLERAQLAQTVQLQSDVSVPLTGAGALWGGVPPNYPSTGKTGRNVIVGIVDSGIDLTCPDFR